MPSLEHEAVVRRLTGRPAVLFDRLRDTLDVDLLANAPGDALGARSVDELTIAVASETLRAFAPTELRADLVLVVEGPRGKLAVVVEVQLRPAVDKRRAWPA